jgi:hypothetical protein
LGGRFGSRAFQAVLNDGATQLAEVRLLLPNRPHGNVPLMAFPMTCLLLFRHCGTLLSTLSNSFDNYYI